MGEHSLAHLPDCLLLSILAALDAPALARVAVVCREMAAIVHEHDAPLWHGLLVRRYQPVRWALPEQFPHCLHGSAPTWRALYARLSLPGEGNWRCLAAARHAGDAAAERAASGDPSCWIVIDGAVYDVTEFMHQHPGMASLLKLMGGTDASDEFHQVPHSRLAHRLMAALEVPGLQLSAEDFPPRFAAARAAAPASRFERLRQYLATLSPSAAE